MSPTVVFESRTHYWLYLPEKQHGREDGFIDSTSVLMQNFPKSIRIDDVFGKKIVIYSSPFYLAFLNYKIMAKINSKGMVSGTAGSVV